MGVAEAFDAVAAGYDAARRRLVPCFDAFYGTAVEVAAPPLRAALAAGRTPEVLDLGAGTGLLSSLLAAAVPGVRLTLVDAAPKMLAVAAEQLTGRGVPHRLVAADLADPLPAGRYDAVVSALAIHHLDDSGKRALYRRAAGALVPGGVFVNAEQVAGPTPDLDRRYHEVWLAQVTALGSDAAEIAAAEQRMTYDRPAPVGEQCRWLAEAGLAEVDCFFKAWRFAVFGGRAPD
ncbi:class I SAM-dependent methyltransferase [Micromonospora sp. WMMD1082]|uniref:class I SAM-dependent methyltransferase n=1 Tax=Micromonospora sp. WMMD1082 TaxID=3016104 RepID=UPI002417AD3B|nr:class I SAM-dependent methyltransferase [Micromonospora sp. WMMD1082]MDG4793970.1 class I SAM-dependent methyltransferase [Micromonospora sp. WMMD1082]